MTLSAFPCFICRSWWPWDHPFSEPQRLSILSLAFTESSADTRNGVLSASTVCNVARVLAATVKVMTLSIRLNRSDETTQTSTWLTRLPRPDRWWKTLGIFRSAWRAQRTSMTLNVFLDFDSRHCWPRDHPFSESQRLIKNFHDAECFPLLYLSLLMTMRSSIFWTPAIKYS